MLRLPADRPIPIEAEPREVLDDRGSVVVAAAGLVDVFEPQQKPAARLARRPPAFERRADMPQVQIPGRARREAGDGLGGTACAQIEFTRVAMPSKTRSPRHRPVTASCGIGYACCSDVVLRAEK